MQRLEVACGKQLVLTYIGDEDRITTSGLSHGIDDLTHQQRALLGMDGRGDDLLVLLLLKGDEGFAPACVLGGVDEFSEGW